MFPIGNPLRAESIGNTNRYKTICTNIQHFLGGSSKKSKLKDYKDLENTIVIYYKYDRTNTTLL